MNFPFDSYIGNRKQCLKFHWISKQLKNSKATSGAVVHDFLIGNLRNHVTCFFSVLDEQILSHGCEIGDVLTDVLYCINMIKQNPKMNFGPTLTLSTTPYKLKKFFTKLQKGFLFTPSK